MMKWSGAIIKNVRSNVSPSHSPISTFFSFNCCARGTASRLYEKNNLSAACSASKYTFLNKCEIITFMFIQLIQIQDMKLIEKSRQKVSMHVTIP